MKETATKRPDAKRRLACLVMWAWCWALFWMGHVTSRALVPLWPGLFYPLYNNLMRWSVNVNDKYGFDVWSEPT